MNCPTVRWVTSRDNIWYTYTPSLFSFRYGKNRLIFTHNITQSKELACRYFAWFFSGFIRGRSSGSILILEMCRRSGCWFWCFESSQFSNATWCLREAIEMMIYVKCFRLWCPQYCAILCTQYPPDDWCIYIHK